MLRSQFNKVRFCKAVGVFDVKDLLNDLNVVMGIGRAESEHPLSATWATCTQMHI
jgi:hypothetical protein